MKSRGKTNSVKYLLSKCRLEIKSPLISKYWCRWFSIWCWCSTCHERWRECVSFVGAVLDRVDDRSPGEDLCNRRHRPASSRRGESARLERRSTDGYCGRSLSLRSRWTTDENEAERTRCERQVSDHRRCVEGSRREWDILRWRTEVAEGRERLTLEYSGWNLSSGSDSRPTTLSLRRDWCLAPRRVSRACDRTALWAWERQTDGTRDEGEHVRRWFPVLWEDRGPVSPHARQRGSSKYRLKQAFPFTFQLLIAPLRCAALLFVARLITIRSRFSSVPMA